MLSLEPKFSRIDSMMSLSSSFSMDLNHLNNGHNKLPEAKRKESHEANILVKGNQLEPINEIPRHKKKFGRKMTHNAKTSDF